MERLKVETSIWEDANTERLVDFPGKWEICERCQGGGMISNPAFSNGITSAEWFEDWDEEEREYYMAGVYDVTCPTCGGSGKVVVVSEDDLTDEEQEDYKIWKEQCDKDRQNEIADNALYRAECRLHEGY